MLVLSSFRRRSRQCRHLRLSRLVMSPRKTTPSCSCHLYRGGIRRRPVPPPIRRIRSPFRQHAQGRPLQLGEGAMTEAGLKRLGVGAVVSLSIPLLTWSGEILAARHPALPGCHLGLALSHQRQPLGRGANPPTCRAPENLRADTGHAVHLRAGDRT